MTEMNLVKNYRSAEVFKPFLSLRHYTILLDEMGP